MDELCSNQPAEQLVLQSLYLYYTKIEHSCSVSFAALFHLALPADLILIFSLVPSPDRGPVLPSLAS